MDMKNIYCRAVKEKHPEIEANTCYEAIANGTKPEETEIHGYLIDNMYFIDSKTLEIYEKNYFILIENIEDSLLD